jgi:hypothetical protein
MMQVREFQKVRTLLFDGESALRSPAVQKEILNKFKKLKFTRNPTGKEVWQKEPSEKSNCVLQSTWISMVLLPPPPHHYA